MLLKADTDAGKFYGVYINIGGDVTASNYKMVLRSGVSKLDISLPSVEGVVVDDETFVYDGKFNADKVVTGSGKPGDIVKYYLHMPNNNCTANFTEECVNKVGNKPCTNVIIEGVYTEVDIDGVNDVIVKYSLHTQKNDCISTNADNCTNNDVKNLCTTELVHKQKNDCVATIEVDCTNDDAENLCTTVAEHMKKNGCEATKKEDCTKDELCTTVKSDDGTAFKYAINAGTYNIKIVVTRPIVDSSENNYNYLPFEKHAILTITPAKIGISAPQVRKLFNNAEMAFDRNTIDLDMSVGLDLADIKMHYEFLQATAGGGGTFEEVDKLIRAGSYKIVLTYNSELAGNQSDNPANFKSEIAEVIFSIVPITIRIVVDDAELKQVFVSETDTTIEFTKTLIPEFESETMPTIKLEYKNVYVDGTQTYVSTVKKAGKYTYLISAISTTDLPIIPSDYLLVGDVTGTFKVGHTSVSSSSNGSSVSVLTDSGDLIFADALVYKEIFESNNSAMDNSYWSTINKNMSRIGDEDTSVSLQAIVQLTVMNNNNKVLPDGTVNMRVALPSSVSSLDDVFIYEVTKEGALKKLNYTYADGFIMYNTDFVDSLVFVKIDGMETWQIALIVVGCLLAVVLLALGVAFGVKAKQKKQFASASDENDINSDDSANSDTTDSYNSVFSDTSVDSDNPSDE